jgi:hypothetical protein
MTFPTESAKERGKFKLGDKVRLEDCAPKEYLDAHGADAGVIVYIWPDVPIDVWSFVVQFEGDTVHWYCAETELYKE